MPDKISIDFLANHPDKVLGVAEWLFDEWGYLRENNSVEKRYDELKIQLSKTTVPIHIIALKDNVLTGVVALKPTEMKLFPQQEYWLGSLFVSPIFRGQGIATLLENEIVSLAKSHSISKLYLQTEALDGGLYRKLGWQGLEIVSDHGITVLVMEKCLV